MHSTWHLDSDGGSSFCKIKQDFLKVSLSEIDDKLKILEIFHLNSSTNCIVFACAITLTSKILYYIDICHHPLC